MLGAHEHDWQFAGVLRQLRSLSSDCMRKGPDFPIGAFSVAVDCFRASDLKQSVAEEVAPPMNEAAA